ncbi:MAG: (2Fe-2S)-binding protein [Planctomycetota bacterium]|nr:(2Fe-2S)-binding protein [Planctomycetota bacterium]
MKDFSPKVGQHTSLCDSGGKSNSGARRIVGNRGTPITFTFDGQVIEAFEGETVAAALLASGVQAMRKTSRKGEPRGLFCNMGICFDCLVEVSGNTNQRGCQFPVTDGLEIKSQRAASREHCK